MTTLTPPRANIPIGWMTAGGQKVAVVADPEWLRYWTDSLFLRSGGTTGSSTGDLETAQFDDAGIDDLKARVSQVADEMTNASAMLHEIRPLMSRIDALELAPVAAESTQETNTVAVDVYAATFLGAL